MERLKAEKRQKRTRKHERGEGDAATTPTTARGGGERRGEGQLDRIRVLFATGVLVL